MSSRVILKYLAAAAVAATISIQAKAQFFTSGDDPGRLQWMQLQTAHYQVIYPKGCDSLALEYGRTLEKYYLPVSRSSGYTPDFSFTKKVPVILHQYAAVSNGVVSTAPHRMELYTTPDMYSPISTPWQEHLILHESRHLSQMQFTFQHQFKPVRWIFGEIGSGLAYALYTDVATLEGDAVVMETALTSTGRGRDAAFLTYYHATAKAGDYRSYYQWRYGSLKNYTPDHYALGYITVAGVRTLWDEPLFTKKVTDRVWKKGLPFLNYPKAIKDVTGQSFKSTFNTIWNSLSDEWKTLDEKRGPFQKMEQITQDQRWPTSYYGNAVADGTNYMERWSLDKAGSLVAVDSCGNIKKLRAFPATYTGMEAGDREHLLWWTEKQKHPRWSLESYSEIVYIDKKMRAHNLTHGGRFFNIKVFGDTLAVIETDLSGNTAAVLMSTGGERIRTVKAPKGMQMTAVVLQRGNIVVSGITANGAGIWRITEDAENGWRFEQLLPPTTACVDELDIREDVILFSSDRSGVRELYALDPDDNSVYQMTCTPLGGHSWSIDDGVLSFCTIDVKGVNLFKTPLSELPVKKVDFSQVYEPHFAHALTRQEMALAASQPDTTAKKLLGAAGTTSGIAATSGAAGIASESSDTLEMNVGKYSKLGHLFKIHSWLPFYVDYDAVSSFSFENVLTSVRLGVSGLFQNDLGTFTALAGIREAPDENWIPSFRGTFTYSGLYPVFEGSFAVGKTSYGNLKIYIPWSWTKGGWTKGLVPQVSYYISSSTISFKNTYSTKNLGSEYEETSYYTYSRAQASLRGYIMRPTATSRAYPELGIGAEVGFAGYPTVGGNLQSNVYTLLYGYVPGILPAHGVKLTALSQLHVGSGKYCTSYANTAPTGYTSSRVASNFAGYPLQSKYTVNYVFPFLDLCWDGLSPFTYIRNLEMTLHGDCSLFAKRVYGSGSSANSYRLANAGHLASAGADLSLVLGNLIWIPYDTRLGVSWAYKWGNLFDVLESEGETHNYVGLVFSVNF